MIELPPNWSWTTLGEVADVSGGLTKNATKRESSLLQVPLVSVAAVQFCSIDPNEIGTIGLLPEDGDRGKLRKGDLLMVEGNGSLAHIGRVAIWDGSVPAARHQNHIIRIRVRALNSKFLLHWFASPEGRKAIVGEATSATGLYTLSLSKVARLPVPLPPLREQHRIIAKLEALLSQAQLAKMVLEHASTLVGRLRQAVFEAAFRGELTADWREQYPDVAPASKMIERIQAERRRSWEKAEFEKMRARGKKPKDDAWKGNYKELEQFLDAERLRKLPDGWMWTRLSAISTIKGGLTLGKKRASNERVRLVPYLRVANVQRGFLDLSEVKQMYATDEEIETLKLQVGDILFNEGGDRDKLGRGWVWSGEIPECIHQNHVFRARLAIGKMQPKFVSWYGNSQGQSYFLSQGKQTTNLASISLSKLSSLPIPVPPGEEQKILVKRLERSLTVINRVEPLFRLMCKRAASLEQALLSKAFRGELVSQDSNDEPAEILLARLKRRRDQAVKIAKLRSRAHSRRVPLKLDTPRPKDLLKVVRAHGGSIAPEELFRASGHLDVEDFYAALRDAVSARRLLVARDNAKNPHISVA